ncbi:MAG: hypothetical protein UIG59_08765 [Acutalibacteraceae bacterium]|nr:hypothetical protein [Acutalibacteraceae bacterium]
MNLKELKSGTDVRGVASDVFGKSVNLTDDAVINITCAFALWLSSKIDKPVNSLKIAVGHDSRISADRISAAVISALKGLGVHIIDCGLASTPAMFMTTVDLHTDGAVQITASHHPADRNGLKFFTAGGGLEGAELSEIITRAEEGNFGSFEGAVLETVDYMSQYAAGLRKMICSAIGKTEEELPLKGYHIVVDAGNGVGGFYARDVLAPLGANTDGSRYLDPDGMFPGHIPNPEDKIAMQSITAAVLESGADFGVIFDTDVDRAGCVDSTGKEINKVPITNNSNAAAATDVPQYKYFRKDIFFSGKCSAIKCQSSLSVSTSKCINFDWNNSSNVSLSFFFILFPIHTIHLFYSAIIVSLLHIENEKYFQKYPSSLRPLYENNLLLQKD